MRVVICGGGVIGAATAYFLARRGVRAVVVEGTAPACAASGKAGGFLARDWCEGTPLAALARRSFVLHARLSDELGANWGYRRLTTYGGTVGHGRQGDRLAWLSADVAITHRLGSPETTAQVHPGEFTAALLHAAQARGAELRSGRITGLVGGDAGRVRGIEVDGQRLAADAVVIAMGPWSQAGLRWARLPQACAVFALKGHSLLFATGSRIGAEALFLEVEDASGSVQTPEIFPRADGTTYVCAISSTSPLPDIPAQVVPDADAMQRLYAICARVSPVLATAKVLARQACYRPITADGLPLIGAVPGVAGVFLATGHSVWGILNAPATGEAMAALLTGAEDSIDVSPFDPGRFGRADVLAEVPGRRNDSAGSP